MASASRPLIPAAYLSRADQLKRELADFVTSGPLKGDYEDHRKAFIEFSGPSDLEETATICDWFMFEWFDDAGQGAVDRFLAHHGENLSERDVKILSDWEDSIHSIFEVRSVGQKQASLRDLDSGDTFPVSTGSEGDVHLERRQFISSRLLPLGNGFIFAGPVIVLPNKDAAMEALEFNRRLDAMSSPRAIEEAQREQCDAFREFFGCDEISLASTELNVTLQQFQEYLLFQRRDRESKLTKAEMFKEEFGCELRLPDPSSESLNFTAGGEVSIICDEFDGIVVLPEYERFKHVFESADTERAVKDSLDLLWTYIKEPEIPTVAFERVAERNPAGVERALRVVLGDDSFSIEHLYALLLHYKQPVEGLDDLEDDERLWDLLDGNGADQAPASKAAKPARPNPADASHKRRLSVKPKSRETTAAAPAGRKKR